MNTAFAKDSDLYSDLVTGEELFESGNTETLELVKGRLVHMPPTGYLHGLIEVKFSRILSLYVEKNKMGHVMGGEVGIYIQRNPDTVRAADVLYISKQRLSQCRTKSYLDVAPELVAEILSPGDRWYDINDKIDEYFSIGVKSVWIIAPKREQVTIYHSPTKAVRYSANEKISDKDILPGFEINVSDLFE